MSREYARAIPSTVELEFARQHDQEHAQICCQPTPRRLRLTFWRDEQLVRNALKVAGEPGLVLDVACGAGRFWPVLGEHANRVILAADPSPDTLDHARSHHGGALLQRIKTFPSSAFTLGLSANAVDCIFVCNCLCTSRPANIAWLCCGNSTGSAGTR